MRKVLGKAFGRERVYNRADETGSKRWDELKDKDVAGFRAVSDHLDFYDNGLSRPCLPVALLRHPLYRAVSLYFFIQKKKNGHTFQDLARSMELDDFYIRASAMKPEYFRNLQCRRVCSEPDAGTALAMIEARYLGVGFTNGLDTFTSALAERLGWQTLPLKTPPADEERYASLITPKFREAVLRENAEDLALFEAVAAGPPYPARVRKSSTIAPMVTRMKRGVRKVGRKIVYGLGIKRA